MQIVSGPVPSRPPSVANRDPTTVRRLFWGPMARVVSAEDPLATWLRTLGGGAYVLIFLAASWAVVIPFAALAALLPGQEIGSGPLSGISLGLLGRLLVGSIVAPLIETTMCQWAPIRLLRSRLGLPWPVVLLTSAALFAATHPYSIGYVVFALLVGIVLAYCYAVQAEAGRRPFLFTCLVHALRNGIAILLP